MARPSKITDLFWLLSFDKNGFTWHQLVRTHKGRGIVEGKKVKGVLNFPKQTLDRHLKILIKKGLVEKEVTRSGRRGRPTGKYKLTGKYWEPDSLIGFTVPYIERDEEGKLLLVRKVRDSSRKNTQRTVVMGGFYEKYLSLQIPGEEKTKMLDTIAERTGWSPEEIAKNIGMSHKWVLNYISPKYEKLYGIERIS